MAEFLAASVPRTVTVWAPSVSAAGVNGEVHAANAPLSTWHWITVAPVTVNATLGVLSLVGVVTAVTLTTGGVVSIVQWNDAVEALPTMSVARTVKLWAPSARLAVVNSEVHAANAPPSTSQANAAVASPELNPNVPVAVFDSAAGLEVIITDGGVASTVQLLVAGVGSTRPEVSRARTAKLCAPSPRVNARGEVQAANAAPSSEHCSVAVGSGEWNANVTSAAVVEPAAGPEVITVSGAVESTVQLSIAGVGSALPAASTART